MKRGCRVCKGQQVAWPVTTFVRPAKHDGASARCQFISYRVSAAVQLKNMFKPSTVTEPFFASGCFIFVLLTHVLQLTRRPGDFMKSEELKSACVALPNSASEVMS